MKPLRTWALIADGGRARIIENSGPMHGEPGHGEAAHEWMTMHDLVFHSEHGTSKSGVVETQGHRFGRDGAGPPPDAVDFDPSRSQKTVFAQHLAAMLDEQLAKGAFHRLIIAAPPAMLGDLRDEISPKVMASVVGEFHHDLTKIPNGEIASHLQPIRLA